jgi:hypothetical protein
MHAIWRKPSEGEVNDWVLPKASQGMPAMARKQPEARREAWNIFSVKDPIFFYLCAEIGFSQKMNLKYDTQLDTFKISGKYHTILIPFVFLDIKFWTVTLKTTCSSFKLYKTTKQNKKREEWTWNAQMFILSGGK